MGPEPMGPPPGGPDPMGPPPAGPDPIGPPPAGPDENGAPEDPEMGDMEGGEGNNDKKNIQQLTGELSQALSQYNDEQDEPDTELNKYVMNMLAKQAGKAMTPKDRKQVVKKLKGDDESDEDMEEPIGDDMPDENESMPENDGGMNESRLNRIIDEVLGDMANKKRDLDHKRYNKEISNKDVTFENPFVVDR